MTRVTVRQSFTAIISMLCCFALLACQAVSAGNTVVAGTSPSSAAAGSAAFTLTVNGSYFSRHSVVLWNGSARSTTFMAGNLLTAAISASDVAMAGTVSVSVRDTHTGNTTNSVTFAVTSNSTQSGGSSTSSPTSLQIVTNSLASGMVGAAYSATLTASGGTSPYSWTLASGTLPAGLTMSTAGAISGQPTTAGTYAFSAQVTDAATSPQSATTLMSIVVAPPALRVTTTALASATQNVAYSATLAASGGTLPYSWSIVSGQLPAGVSLNASTGTIAGTPTANGTFPITVQANDSTSATAQAALSLVVATQSSTVVQRFYSDTSFWNTPIAANATVDANSSAIIAKAIAAYASNANFSNTDAWGIGLAYATPASTLYTVLCTTYCTGDTIQFAIPSGALPSTGSDHHLAVVNGTQELDMWEAAYNSTSNSWSAGSRMINDASGWGASCTPGQHCNGAVAAGFALLGGAIRPEEIAQGHIDHALSITTPYTRSSYIACPATHTDGKYADTSAIPEGALIQLDPSFDVDAQSWPAWEKVIAKALQTYGAYVSDTGGSLAIRGITDMNAGSATWSSAGTPKGPSLSNLPWSSFRVLTIQSCN